MSRYVIVTEPTSILITIPERDRLSDGPPVHVCAVLATQILDGGLAIRHDDLSVPARERDRIDADDAIGIAAHHVRPSGQKPLAAARDKARTGVCVSGAGDCGRWLRVTVKGVAVSGDRADVPRRPWRIPECGADLRNQVVQTRVGDERLRPQTLEQFRLGNSLRPSIEKQLQELEGLGGKRHRTSMAKKRPPTGVELALSKNDTHGNPEGIRVS